MNMNAQDFPYWVTLVIQGVRLEKLKMDTAVKDKDIAGTLQAEAKLNGFAPDLTRINGAGKILINDGKLWQLNLMQGLGKILFVKDFANIIFNEASCDFTVQDKYVSTENLKLKSNISDLEGRIKIGFDSSLDGLINVKVLDEAAPLNGTFKDIATAIIGQAGRFGAIKITGTLQDPKYKFETAVGDIIKTITGKFFGGQ